MTVYFPVLVQIKKKKLLSQDVPSASNSAYLSSTKQISLPSYQNTSYSFSDKTNLIKIRPLIVPGFAMRDITKPGAIKGRILIRL